MPTRHDFYPLRVFQQIGTFCVLRTVWVQREEHPRRTAIQDPPGRSTSKALQTLTKPSW